MVPLTTAACTSLSAVPVSALRLAELEVQLSHSAVSSSSQFDGLIF
jgi:hypothetical protein